MRFIPSSIEGMRTGHKTQTRRVQKESQYFGYSFGTGGLVMEEPTLEWTIPSIIELRKDMVWVTKWQVGRRYAIQPAGNRNGAKAIGSFLCTSLRAERLQDISEEDVIAEGIHPAQSIYGRCRWGFANGLDDIIYTTAVFAFECLWEIINNKPRRRWADNPKVFVIGMGEFEWKEERCLLETRPKT